MLKTRDKYNRLFNMCSLAVHCTLCKLGIFIPASTYIDAVNRPMAIRLTL